VSAQHPASSDPASSDPAPSNPARPTVVVLHAHPDDEAIFTGLTIRRLTAAGARVVLVTATGGEEGESRVPLPRGESVRGRRVAELERACELLGVARLEVLPYRDSGCHRGPFRPDSLGAAPVAEIARRVAAVTEGEGAAAIVYDDPNGIYGHIDHVQAHRAGAWVAARMGITGYQATVDTAEIDAGPLHVLHGAASSLGGSPAVGVPAERISLTVHAGIADLLAKMAAMAAHSSQIGPEYLDPLEFAAAYGREWFVRRGRPGILEDLLGAQEPVRAVRPPQAPGKVLLAAG
jgi:LmbE family N-acetylglucosaminyl deacetylase